MSSSVWLAYSRLRIVSDGVGQFEEFEGGDEGKSASDYSGGSAKGGGVGLLEWSHSTRPLRLSPEQTNLNSVASAGSLKA